MHRGTRVAAAACGLLYVGLVAQALVAGGQTRPAPHAADAAAKVLYKEKGCPFCHGENLQGTEKAPSLLGIGKRLSLAEITQQIEVGGGNMPAFADSFEPAELQAVAEMLSHQKSVKPHAAK